MTTNETAYPLPDSNVVLNDLAAVLNRHYEFVPLNVRYQAATKALEIVERDRVCFGCGSRRVVVRQRKAYCTEISCDRRLPGPSCKRCGRPAALHVCLACSPDGLSPGGGCINCRQTGWSQSPCSVAEATKALERSDPQDAREA